VLGKRDIKAFGIRGKKKGLGTRGNIKLIIKNQLYKNKS
tara:strand:+ start:203 stop:319 length:117 start_codon:yes stop_codon:yes gene_type:complete